MILTARQLEELHRGNGNNGTITLPYRARLSPLAQDWLRHKKVQIGYADVEKPSNPDTTPAPSTRSRTILWWCDGPCGHAKGALLTVARETGHAETEIAVDPTRIVEAIRLIAREIKESRAAAAVLLVSSGATAMVYTNRCPSLRAVLGTCRESVEQGATVAANVLVIEHPHKSLPQVKLMLTAFLRGLRDPTDDVSRRLKELSTCG